MTPGGDAASNGRRLSRADRLKVRLALLVLPGLIRLLKSTYRTRLVEGDARLRELLADSPAVVLAGWHEGLLVCGSFLVDRLISKGFPLALLVSMSRDGEIMAKFVDRLGVATVRGSTSRGALGGLRRLYRTLSKEGRSVGLAPDGPRGPARHCQPGALLLAQLAAVPLVPIAGSADRAWRLGSWDRMLVPKPFARLTIAVGEPVHVAPDLGSEGLARESERLAAILNELTERADAALGD